MLLISVPLLACGQDSLVTKVPSFSSHTVFAGLQAPLNYTLGYRFQVNRHFSVQAQGGLIAAPFDRYTLKILEGFGLDPNLSRVIDRSFRQGSSAGLGVNYHANYPWYAGVYGQYIHFSAGPITPADGLGVYFKQDFSGFNPLNSPSFVFNLQSNLWVAGVRAGRSFRIDGLGITQRLYNSLDNEIDTKLRQHGFLPTLNVLLTYRLR